MMTRSWGVTCRIAVAALFLGGALAVVTSNPLHSQTDNSSWHIGLARVKITPENPIRMAGYASRTKPFEGVDADLFAKAMAFEDSDGNQSLLITADMIRFPGWLSEAVCRRLKESAGIERNAVLLNASHTHAGPVVGRNLAAAYPTMTDRHWADVDEYTRELEDQLVRLIGRAVEQLAPARLRFERTRAGFAVNRRRKTQAGYRGGGDNWEGPVDHDVPVLRVEDAAGD